jgi:hypothetical protein
VAAASAPTLAPYLLLQGETFKTYSTMSKEVMEVFLKTDLEQFLLLQM